MHGLTLERCVCLCVCVCVLCNFLGLCTAPIGSEGRRRSREDEEEEALKRKQLQEEHLNKVSNKTATKAYVNKHCPCYCSCSIFQINHKLSGNYTYEW